MSNRIKECFAKLEQEGKKALIPFVTAGDSNKTITVPLMHRMVESGADIIELGIPFSALEVGIDGLLTVDLPPEESNQLAQILAQYDIDPIFLLSPTTTDERIERIVNAGSGYLYYVSLKGVTGSSILNVEEVAEKVATIRTHTNLPIGVGFGIKDAESASSISAVSDGVIVGSAIVKIIENNIDDTDTILNQIGALLKSMRTAMDA